MEGYSRRTTRRLTIAFRAVAALGGLCLAAAGLAAVLGLAQPAAAHGSAQPAAVDTGFAGATRDLATSQPGPLLAVSPLQLDGSSRAATDKALATATDAVIRDATVKAPPVVAQPVPGGSALGLASAPTAGGVRARSPGTITIETFGYSFGDAPSGSKFVADVRNIPTDGFDFTQSQNGLMPSVRERVMSTTEAQTWLSTMRSKWMPALRDGDKVAIGCSRGHHRSVTLGVLFAEDLRAAGYTVVLVHRDITKTW